MLAVMNPPKGKKKRKQSAKQRAWQKKFPQMYGGKKKRSTGGASSSSSKGKKVKKKSSSKRKGSGVPRSGSGRKRRFGGGGGGNIFRDLARGGMGGTIQGAAGLAGFVATSKLADFLPETWLKDSTGQIPTWKRFAAKIGTALAIYVPTRVAGHVVKGKAGALLKGAAESMLAGSVVNIGYDALARATKGKIAPSALAGGVAGGEMGQLVFQQLTEQPQGVGAFVNSGALDAAFN